MRTKVAAKRASRRHDLLPAPATQAPPVRAAELPDIPLVVLEGEPPGLQDRPTIRETVQAGRVIVPQRPSPAGFHTALALHFHCRRIRRADNPHERMFGFNCACGGAEREWQVPLTDLRHYDPSIIQAMQLLIHADDEDNWEARRGINVENMARMGIDVARVVRRRSREMVKLEEARKKARALLRKNVSKEQWAEFVKGKHFHVEGSDGRVYRIEHQVGSNVTLILDGQDAKRYCLVPKGHEWIPEPDVMLAVKLMIETNARSFIRRANVMDLRRAG